jgi:hypothetical protein
VSTHLQLIIIIIIIIITTGKGDHELHEGLRGRTKRHDVVVCCPGT